MNNALTIKCDSLRDIRTYGVAALFIAGNIILPQLCHLIPNGGLMFLPIYFFTLIGAYLYGWRVGVLTAVLSPLINSMFFGMPPVAALPVIEVKSLILAAVAAGAACKFGKASLVTLLGVVIASQVLGGAFEWAWTGRFAAAVQDFRIGLPGLLIQIVGGYAILRALGK